MNSASPAARWATIDRVILGAIVAAACLLRLWDLPLVSITADEGIHGLFARNVSLLDFDKFPAVGLPSVGVRNSAFFIYLLAIPNFVVRHPLSGAAFIALLQVAAIAMTYRYTLSWLGRTAAVTVATFWTFSPWAVLYARNMWPPSALAPFVVLFLALGTRWFIAGDRRALGWSAFLCFLLPQVHFSGFCAPVWMAVLLGIRSRSISPLGWRTIAIASFVGLLTWGPWIHWQHFANHWQDLAQIKSVAQGGAGPQRSMAGLTPPLSASRCFIQLFDYFRDLLHTGGLNYWFRTPEADLPEYFPRWLAPLRFIVDRGLELAFIVGMFVAARSVVGRLLLLWIAIPLLLLAAIRPTLHPHYEFIAYPAPYLVVGVGAQALLSTPGRRAFAGAALAIACLAFLLTLDGWRRYVADDRLDGGDRYQLSYRQRWRAALAVIDDAGQTQVQLVGPFNGQQPAYMLPFLHEVEIRGRGRWPLDAAHVYWIDELLDYSDQAADDVAKTWPHLQNIRVERSFKVGPTRIFRLTGKSGPPPH